MGIANITNNILTDSGITVTSLPSGSGTTNEISYWVSASSIGSLTTATYPSLTELSYVKGVTSAIQTQFSGKQDTLTLTTTGTSGAATLVGSTLNIPQYSGGGGMAIGGSITSATEGSVLFAGTSGVLQQDNANLFWDDTNNRLGIGTATPSSVLHTVGSVTASSAIAIGNYMQPTVVAAANNDVLVGLGVNTTFTNGAFTGVSNFLFRLSSNGTLRSQINNLGIQSWTLNSGSAEVGYISYSTPAGTPGILFFNSTNTGRSQIRQISTGGFLLGATTTGSIPNDQFALFPTGNVLIQNGGTFTDNGFRLDVNGTARVQDSLLVSKSTASSISVETSTTSSFASIGVKTGTIGGLFRAYGSAFSVTSLASTAGFGPDGATGLVIFTNSTLTSGGTGSLSIRGGGYDTAAECLVVDQTGTTFTKQLKSTVAGSTTTGAGQIYLNGATGNRIDFNQNGVAAPAFTTRSAGTKITLYPAVDATNVDYAIGIEGSTQWYSIPQAVNTFAYKWYAGTTNILSLNGIGNMTLSRNQNGVTKFEISNTTSGTGSAAQLFLTSDAAAGTGSINKASSTTTAYKIVAARDAYIYNTTAGDIAILNDFASGTIKFAAGGVSSAQATLTAAGRLLIGTTTESTFLLDVNGTARVSGLITASTGVQYTRLNPTTTTTASTATLTPDISLGDLFTITAQAVALSVANPTGTPVNGQKMTIRIEDNGTARAITWSGTQYRASTDLALPTTTIATKTMYLGFIYNSTDTKWDLIAFINNF